MKRLVNSLFISVIFSTGITYFACADDINSGKKLIESPDNSQNVINNANNQSTLDYQGYQNRIPEGLPKPVLVADDPPGNFIPPDDWGFKGGGPGAKPKLMIMWNLVEYLDLDEDAATTFFPIFNKHNEKRDELMHKHRELITDIINKVDNESVSVKELSAMLDQFDRITESIDEAHESYLEEAKEVLNDRQYVKLVIFNDKLKLDLFNRYSSRGFSSKKPSLDNVTGSEGDQEPQLDAGKNFRRNIESEKRKFEDLQKLLHNQQEQIEKQQKQIEELMKRK